MFKITTAFKACENGVDVIEYPVGEVDSLPEIALEHAKNNGFIEEIEPKKAKKTDKATKKAENKAD